MKQNKDSINNDVEQGITFKKFDTMAFRKGMKVKHRFEEWLIYSVDFDERLLGLVRPEDLESAKAGLGQPSWARCENCILLNSTPNVQGSDTTGDDSSNAVD
jgi:hypothetical protein